MKRVGILFINSIVAVLGVAGLAAQPSPDQQLLASQLRINQEDLQHYTWKSKYTYTVDGVQKRVEEYTGKYFTDGTQQMMQVSGQVDKEKVRLANGKKLSKKEREAGYAFVMEVKGQLNTYFNPLFAEKAVSTATMTTSEDILILKSHDVVTQGDLVVIHFSLPDLLPKTAVVTTTVEQSPVSLEIEFDTLEIGPSCSKRSITTATWQGLNLVITTENSDYQRHKH